MDRLNWARNNQTKLRAEMYQGVVDAVDAGDTAQQIGRRIVLPSSFIGGCDAVPLTGIVLLLSRPQSVPCVAGGARQMQQQYQDSMAVVRKRGKPDFFITFTCNPRWPEITENLLNDQKVCEGHNVVLGTPLYFAVRRTCRAKTGLAW